MGARGGVKLEENIEYLQGLDSSVIKSILIVFLKNKLYDANADFTEQFVKFLKAVLEPSEEEKQQGEMVLAQIRERKAAEAKDSIVQEEYERFLREIQDIVDKKLSFGKYLCEHEYQDNYSDHDIYDAQEELRKKIVKYLHINYPGQYIATRGHAISVMTPEKARAVHMWEETINRFLVK